MKKILICLSLAVASPAFASQTAPHNLPPVDPVTVASEAREDVGDLRPPEELPLTAFFHGDVQAQGQYTSNAFLHGNEGSSDFLWFPSMQGGFTVPLGKKFTLDTSSRLESAIYSRFQDRGFYGTSADLTLDYQALKSLPHLYVGVQPYYYLGFDTGDRLAEAVAFSTGVTDYHFLFRGKTMLFGGYNFSNFVASPSTDNRNAHRAMIGVTQQLSPATYTQLFYAFQFSDYFDNDRRDSRHVVGLNFVYQFSEHLFGTVAGSFVNNHSTNSLASYQSLMCSTGLTFQF
jgi:hypothetical protein